jgi:hypothetical protein
MIKRKIFRRKRSWPNFNVVSQHSPGRVEESRENIRQDSRSAGRDLNPGPPDYEAGMFLTRPRRSATALLPLACTWDVVPYVIL